MREFKNKSFWDGRYTKNPDLGSGPGSRGNNAIRKRQYVDNLIVQNNIESVLDYGCGDLNCVTVSNISKYCGIDISKVIIDRNANIFPQHMWATSIEQIEQNLLFDLVICNDVLIHQDTREKFDKIFNDCLNRTKKYFIFTILSSEREAKNNVFYYNLEQKFITNNIMNFRDVSMYLFQKNSE